MPCADVIVLCQTEEDVKWMRSASALYADHRAAVAAICASSGHGFCLEGPHGSGTRDVVCAFAPRRSVYTARAYLRVQPRADMGTELETLRPRDAMNLNEVKWIVLMDYTLVTGRYFQTLDHVLRKFKGVPTEPFGGIKVLCVGDAPPVRRVTGDDYITKHATFRAMQLGHMVLPGPRCSDPDEQQYCDLVTDLREGQLRPLSRQFLDDRLCRPAGNAKMVLCSSVDQVLEANWKAVRDAKDVCVISTKGRFPTAVHVGCTVRLVTTARNNIYKANEIGVVVRIGGKTCPGLEDGRHVVCATKTTVLHVRLGATRVVKVPALTRYKTSTVEVAYAKLAKRTMGRVPVGISVHFKCDLWASNLDIPYIVFARVPWKQLTTSLCSAEFEEACRGPRVS